MKHRPLLFLVLPLLLLAMGLFGARSWSGSGDVASANVGTGTPHLEVDLVKDGSTWCNPVDTTFSRPVNAAVTYEIALCLSDATSSPAGFNLDLIYNDTLNSCTDLEPGGASLDDNPDANAGSTTFTTPDLGTGWNCNFGSVDPPVCDKDPLTGAGKGRAYMQCGCTNIGCATLAVGAGTSKPIAVITMKAISAGADSISLDSVSIINEDGIEFVNCYSGGPCQGATDTKTGGPTPGPTATSTARSTATATPSCGLPGQPACPTSTPTSRAQTKTPTPAATSTPGVTEPTTAPPPPPPPPSGGQQPVVTPPSTGTGSEGVTWATTLTWALGGGAALSLFLSGLYLRRVKNR